MKKMSMMCMIALCLARSSVPSPQPSLESGWDWLKRQRKEDFEVLRTEYNDPVKLRKHLEDGLLRQSGKTTIEAFKQMFGVSDEMVQAVLMSIIREAVTQTGQKDNNPREGQHHAEQHLEGAVIWLSHFPCADAREVKQIMMAIATDTARDRLLRLNAISSYMDYADAQETRDMIAQFFGEGMKTTFSPYGYIMYNLAIRVYDKAEGDTQTREAIVASMSAALVKEENKRAFSIADKLLAERSKEYADSPQRKAALERMGIPVEKGEQ